MAPRTAAFLFWIALAAFLLFSLNFPKEVSNHRWFLFGAGLIPRAFMGVWVLVDAKEYEFSAQRRGNYGALSIFLGEIVVAIYLVKSRGWKGAGKTLLRILGYLAAVVLSTALLQTAVSFGRKLGV